MHYLLYIVLWFPALLGAHPFHVSVCEITYKAGSQYVEITHKIFLDDLENALNKKYGQSLDVLNPKQPELLDSLIENYIMEKFSIVIDGKPYTPHFLGREVQGDAMWCYLEIEAVGAFAEVQVTNAILLESFDDQTNLVHVKKGDKWKSMRLYEDEAQGVVRFK